MIRIKSIKVENFKSLVDFTIDLSKFNCLIGLNGSGKSTVLQLIDFLSQLVRGDMKGWLEERKWKPTDLKSKLTRKGNIDFCVCFADEHNETTGQWDGSYNPSRNRCTGERIDTEFFTLEVTKDICSISGPRPAHPRELERQSYRINFDYDGTILSALKEELLPPPILEYKHFFQEVKSFDLLAPEHLRRRTRESSGNLGLGGQNLSSFLHEMSDPMRMKLIARLKQVYPQLEDLHVKSLRSGWKQIEIRETYDAPEVGFFPRMTTEARHINDGMLRLIAILAELQSDHRFLLFDEIENGINPELVEFVLDALVSTPKQIMVTTHSPMILNYIDDEVARQSVLYLYKTRHGHTKEIPFFSIPSLEEKLTVMGPGEAFVDTDLTALGEEIEAITEGQ